VPNTTLHVFDASSGRTWGSDSGDSMIVEDSDTVRLILNALAWGGYLFADASVKEAGGMYYDFANDILSFRTNDVANRMVIDNSGNVGIGTTSPGADLDIQGTNGQNTFRVSNTAGNRIASIWPTANADGGFVLYNSSGDSTVRFEAANGDSWINTGGNVGIGTTNPVFGKLDILVNSGTGIDRGLQLIDEDSSVTSSDNLMRLSYTNDDDVTGTYLIDFEDSGGRIGSITAASATTVAYNTASDYRLKENVVEMTDGLARLSKLKPYRFNFIGENVTMDGFFAHEVQEIVPIAVSGEKDAVNEDGSIDVQGLDYSKLVPLIVKAIQELKSEKDAEIAQLKAENTALKSEINQLKELTCLEHPDASLCQ
jgi:hypothetical protein